MVVGKPSRQNAVVRPSGWYFTRSLSAFTRIVANASSIYPKACRIFTQKTAESVAPHFAPRHSLSLFSLDKLLLGPTSRYTHWYFPMHPLSSVFRFSLNVFRYFPLFFFSPSLYVYNAPCGCVTCVRRKGGKVCSRCCRVCFCWFRGRWDDNDLYRCPVSKFNPRYSTPLDK